MQKKMLCIIQSKKVKISWLEETKQDLKEINITEDTIRNRKAFGNLVANHTFKETPKKITGKQWTEERKKQHSEFMKRFWEEKKKKQPSTQVNKFKRAL